MREYNEKEAAAIRNLRGDPPLVRENYLRMCHCDRCKKKIDPMIWWMI